MLPCCVHLCVDVLGLVCAARCGLRLASRMCACPGMCISAWCARALLVGWLVGWLQGLIYRKALQVDMVAASSGQVTNLMSNDCMKIQYGSLFIQNLYFQPISTLICMVLLYVQRAYVPW